MEKQFWAKCGKKQVGPFATREAAVDQYRETHPAKSERDRKNRMAMTACRIMTGYGNGGPWFDIRWHPAFEGA